MHRNKSASSHQFAMVPRAEIPRSSFAMQKTLKTAFDAGYLVPILCEEVLPGDTFNCKLTAFARLATPIFPVMDNLHLETFFFFVPNRLVWANWKRFMGEQANPADSISFTVPFVSCPNGGWAIGSVADYMGLPTVGQIVAGDHVDHSSLPLRAYNLIYNEWFRDENLQDSAVFRVTDAGDSNSDWPLRRRGKRHDYFTSCLPWTQKGGVAVTLPLGTTAPVLGLLTSAATAAVASGAATFGTSAAGDRPAGTPIYNSSTLANQFFMESQAVGAGGAGNRPLVFADLSAATAATINQLRQAFQIQRLLERDARGGSRYTEIVRSHFGVVSPDARLQRPEYLGGGRTDIIINPIAQTSGTGQTGQTTPLGNLGAMGTGLARGHGFTQSFTEHGYVLGLANVHADLTYQQGIRRHWKRSTRYDFYFPVFSMLGEQAVLNQEIYVQGNAQLSGGQVIDGLVFGYQERWAEYRYNPSEITGLFRSTAAGTIDPWHLSQRFVALPTLNSTFISDTPPLSRILAVGAGANGQQILMDCFYDMKVARPLPLYSVPGMIDHF